MILNVSSFSSPYDLLEICSQFLLGVWKPQDIGNISEGLWTAQLEAQLAASNNHYMTHNKNAWTNVLWRIPILEIYLDIMSLCVPGDFW